MVRRTSELGQLHSNIMTAETANTSVPKAWTRQEKMQLMQLLTSLSLFLGFGDMLAYVVKRMVKARRANKKTTGEPVETRPL